VSSEQPFDGPEAARRHEPEQPVATNPSSRRPRTRAAGTVRRWPERQSDRDRKSRAAEPPGRDRIW